MRHPRDGRIIALKKLVAHVCCPHQVASTSLGAEEISSLPPHVLGRVRGWMEAEAEEQRRKRHRTGRVYKGIKNNPFLLLLFFFF